VPRDVGWTYSLVFPPSQEWYALNAVESYRCAHLWVQGAFERVGCRADLAVEARKEAAAECFFGAEKFDLVIRHRKIAGAAQRRNKCGLLIQGSIQPSTGIIRSEWEKTFCEVATEKWNAVWTKFEASQAFEAQVSDLVKSKYGQAQYNQRR